MFSQHSLRPQLSGARQVLWTGALLTKKLLHEDHLANSFINLWAFSDELEWESMIDAPCIRPSLGRQTAPITISGELF